MNARTRWILLTAAFLIPVAAAAQLRTAPVKTAVQAKQAAAPAQAVDPSPDDDLELAEMVALGFHDQLLAPVAEGGGGADGDKGIGRGGHRMGGRHHGGMRGMGRGMGHGGFGLRARWSELNLTDAQRTKLQALHESQAREAVQRRADMQLARLDLQKLMREDRPSQSAVNTQIDRIARLQAQGMKARFETHMQARALLTPEQVKKLRDGTPETRPQGDFD